MGVAIETLATSVSRDETAGLSALLQDVVASGASIGFLPPLDPAEAADYWAGVVSAVRDGTLVLLVAREGGSSIIGSAQLALETRPNGRHRAEVAKVMVLRRARRQGIGRALMLAAEAEARRRGRTTLFLDTRRGNPAERLYRSVGWRYAGSIPRYARSAGGTLDANAIYYKLLPDPGAVAAEVSRSRLSGGRAPPEARGARWRPGHRARWPGPRLRPRPGPGG